MKPSTVPFVIHDLQDSQMFALAQAAGRAGFEVLGLASEVVPWVQYSRYVQYCATLPSLGDVVPSVYALNLKYTGVQGVWLPCVDDIAAMTAEFSELLQEQGLLHLIPDETSMERADVSALQGFDGCLQIPETYWWSCEEALQHVDNLPYPVILKSARGAFQVFDREASLITYLEANRDSPLLQRIQRYIPGETLRMATAMLLFDANGQVVRGFTGRRLRVAKTQYGAFGETTAAKAEWIPELYEGAVALLEHIGWRGFAEVECKQDVNGQWFVMEVNPRTSGWLCLAEADGAGFLQAYHTLCSQGSVLQSCCLQRSKTHYTRMLAAGWHAPDWVADANLPDGKRARAKSLAVSAYQWFRSYPDMQGGALDKLDWRASWTMLKKNLREAFFTR